MKRISFLTILLLLLSFSISNLQAQEVRKSVNKVKPVTKSLKIDTKSVEFSKAIKNSKKINITSGSSWKVVSKTPWLTISPLKGSKNSAITIKTNKANPNVKNRIGSVKIVEETGLERIITVTQLGKGR